mmetsp:Transcript_137931/g.384672  ORF Transcript_137931/g.384672 Transcript_137931/m.384672 type:complete len:728 (+) Transcript_137931:117-2300(+)|eukprot:CAMPEP_0179168722 /NCGR_PEP_ID=MMETSP0796-20121207/83005_1 /TAXON_ID=73915 /ORGANISM="Pyrodinium bahamense, Strain pbaha01" /LENGTH=727 /DNA_ID=CAMNT_0020871499 /DNA_START=38 /DNA_END=2221 /DNA_ORIENTATION=-
MSGGVFNVFQAVQFAPQKVQVPEELQGAVLKLKPSDGEGVEVEAEAACISDVVREFACLNGPEVVLECPMTKAVLSRVIDYMRHHKDNPPEEVQTPLRGENIADCGVSKWDANFIKVDKDMLFELMYAAGSLNIRSLTFLCCAQAALTLKGKSADKLRKEFNLTNDLPADEAERLTGTYNDMMSRTRFPPEEGALDSFAAVLHGVQAAAERNGGLAHGATEAPRAASINVRSWRAHSWRAMVMQDWQQLWSTPDEIRADRGLMFAAVEQSRGEALRLASDALKADRALVLRAVHYSGDILEAASDSLRGDRDFVLEAILAGDGSALKGASDQLRRDRALVLSAAGLGRGAALQGAAESLRGDERFALEVLARDPVAYKYISDELLRSIDFAIAAAKRNGKVVQYMPGAFRADRDVALAAVSNDAEAFSLIHAARRSELLGPDLSGPPGPEVPDWPPKPRDGPMHMGVPLTAQAAQDGLSYVTVKGQKFIMFTAMSTITPNMGQSNYIAANAFMDKMPFYSRPEIDTVGIMWGTVGGMGMRFKAFGSQDFMNMTPDNLLSINDCCKILHVIGTLMDPPEWFAANFLDEGSRNAMLAPTAGMIQGEAVAVTPPVHQSRPPARASARDPKEAQAKRGGLEEKEDTAGPLGGWPRVARSALAQVEPILSEPGQGIYEGAPVVLTGIKNKMNGATGTLLQIYKEGKCRVALDNGKGNALLRPENLQVVMAAA